MSDSSDLTFFQTFRKVLGIALPIAFSFTFSFEVFASGVLIARYNDDEDHMAAITIISTFMNTFMTLGMAPLFGMAIVASNWIGDLKACKRNGDLSAEELMIKRARISAVNRSGLMIVGGAAIPTFLVLFFSQAVATTIFRQDEKVAGIAQEYLRPYALAVPGVLARIAFEQIIFAIGKTRHAMYMGLGSFTVGILSAIWLGLSNWGIPALGLKGIALGFMIESYLIALMFGIYIHRKSECKEFQFFNLFNVQKEIIHGVTSHLLNWAGPFLFMLASELLMTFAVGVIAGKISSPAQAALSFMMQFIFFAYIFCDSFGLACQQEVGRLVGAKCYQGASQLARYSLGVALVCITPICILVSAWPALLQKMLNNQDESIVETTSILTPIMTTGIIFDAARYTMLQGLRSLADRWGATIISSAGLAIGLGLSAVLGLTTELGVYGVGIGYSAGLAIATLGLAYRWIERTKVEYVETVNRRMETLPSFKSSLIGLFSCRSDAILDGEMNERLPLLVNS